MSTITSDPSPRGSSGSKSACLFDPRDGSTSGVSVLVALGSSGAVSAARFDPLTGAAGNTPRCLIRSNSLARLACPDGGVTDSPSGIGGGNVALVGAGSLLPLAASVAGA